MAHFTKKDIIDLPRLERSNLINSCGGIKSGNLIGTVSESGITNLAVFNSVIHLGSNPPLLSFMLRPTTVDRHTYDNFKSNSYFTVNHIHEDFIDKAHQTSAKYESGVSEFNEVGLTEDYIQDFKAPFVKESRIKMGCKYVNEYLIEENQCRLIIGEIQHLLFEDQIQRKDGFLNLSEAHSAGIIGLDAYVKTNIMQRFAYARPDQEPKAIEN